MASDLNVVLMTGRLVVEPELRFTSRGLPAASLRLASTRYWKAPEAPEGEFQKRDVFITIETFGKTAERVAGSRHKGDALMVRGRLIYDEWTDGKGEKRRVLKVASDDIAFVPSTRHAADPAESAAEAASGEDHPPEDADAQDLGCDAHSAPPQEKQGREHARLRH